MNINQGRVSGNKNYEYVMKSLEKFIYTIHNKHMLIH